MASISSDTVCSVTTVTIVSTTTVPSTAKGSNSGSGIMSGSTQAVGAEDQSDSIPAAAGGGKATALPGIDAIDPLVAVNEQVRDRGGVA